MGVLGHRLFSFFNDFLDVVSIYVFQFSSCSLTTLSFDSWVDVFELLMEPALQDTKNFDQVIAILYTIWNVEKLIDYFYLVTERSYLI